MERRPDRLLSNVGNFLQEVRKNLPEIKPPTFLQRFRDDWQALKDVWSDSTFGTKAYITLAGIAVISAGIGAVGGSMWLAEEWAGIQNLKNIATPFLWTGVGGLGAFTLGSVTLLTSGCVDEFNSA